VQFDPFTRQQARRNHRVAYMPAPGGYLSPSPRLLTPISRSAIARHGRYPLPRPFSFYPAWTRVDTYR
jgi:hypothetical protein